MTQSARLKRVPYHFGSPRRSRGSKVPKNATQQTPNGFARPTSKRAARTGAVVMVEWTPPGKRTGKAAATKVTPIQKASRIRSISGGGGNEARIRMSTAAAPTGQIVGRSGIGTAGNQGGARRRVCEAT